MTPAHATRLTTALCLGPPSALSPKLVRTPVLTKLVLPVTRPLAKASVSSERGLPLSQGAFLKVDQHPNKP